VPRLARCRLEAWLELTSEELSEQLPVSVPLPPEAEVADCRLLTLRRSLQSLGIMFCHISPAFSCRYWMAWSPKMPRFETRIFIAAWRDCTSSA